MAAAAVLQASPAQMTSSQLQSVSTANEPGPAARDPEAAPPGDRRSGFEASRPFHAEEPAAEGAEIIRLRSVVEAFVAMEMVPNLAGEVSRADEDAAAREAFRAKAEAMQSLVEELTLAAGQHPMAFVLLAEVRANMADSLVQMPQPAYLNAAQTAHYDEAMRSKAQNQYDQAWEALEAAEDGLAENHPAHADIEVAFARLRAR